MLFDYDEIELVDYDNFYAEAAKDIPTNVLDHHLKEVVNDITKNTNIANRLITLELPKAYTTQETYDISGFLQGDILNRILSVKGTNDHNPTVINRLEYPNYFALTFNYPKDIYIFNRPAVVRELQIHYSFILNRTAEGVPQILLDKYRDVVISGLLARLALHNPKEPNSLTSRIGIEWANIFNTGKARIKADLVNELSPKSYTYKTRFSL